MTRAGTMASVSGIFILNVVPWPSSVRTSTDPPIFSMLVRTTSIPTPRPDTFVTAAAVEKPGIKISCTASLSDIDSATLA